MSPAGRHVSEADLASAGYGCQARPIGREKQTVGTRFIVRENAGRSLPAQVPDENPVWNGNSGQPSSVGRDRDRRCSRQVSRDRAVDSTVNWIAEG